MKTTAKLFKSGRSQAVRLPKEFRFEGTEVRIHREGQRVVLEPIRTTRAADEWAWLDDWRERYGHFIDDDFIAAVNEKERGQERPGLDDLFDPAPGLSERATGGRRD